MKAKLPALLLCGTLSAVVASVVSLLMVESAEVPPFDTEIRPPNEPSTPVSRPLLAATAIAALKPASKTSSDG